jgi:hypothetical protein
VPREISQRLASPTFHSMLLRPVSAQQMKNLRHDYDRMFSMTIPREIGCAASMEEQLIMNFLESEAKVSGCSQAMMASGNYSGNSQRVPKQLTRLTPCILRTRGNDGSLT